MIFQIFSTGFPLRINAIFEIIAFLAGAIFIDLLFFEGNRFYHTNIHPFWILVVLISVQYGSLTGMIAAIASSVLLLYGNIPVRTYDQNIHDWFLLTIKLPCLWFVSAVVIGEISSRHIAIRHEMARALVESKQREAALNEACQNLNAVKERLEVRIAGQWRTVLDALKTAKKMESMQVENALEHSLSLIKLLLGADECSIYTFKENKLVHHYGTGLVEGQDYLLEFHPKDTLFTAIVGEKRILSIVNPNDEILLGKQGIMAGPLADPETGEIVGMLKIEKIGFSHLSIETINMFEFLCEWIGALHKRTLNHEARKKILAVVDAR